MMLFDHTSTLRSIIACALLAIATSTTAIAAENDVALDDGHLFAVGSTGGGTAGGLDGILLDIDAFTGDLLDSILWGGAADDLFNDVSIIDSALFAGGYHK